MNKLILFLIGTSLFQNVFSQELDRKKHYIGILPSVLVEPYDSINAVEINILPFVYEYKLNKSLGLQVRSIVNYRIFKSNSGISQTGGTVLLNKYFYSLFGEEFWLTPQVALFYTYGYNQIDKIQTMTSGLELGVYVRISDSFSLNLDVQPGINYYPNQYSQKFVGTKSGFKPHFGIVFHIGYHF